MGSTEVSEPGLLFNQGTDQGANDSSRNGI